ncbi:DRTGG domain-containing protein [Phosphitispora sp. TUW77]|uniref:DRTGG domain-containing protein n=1 Tax=Phosphitispora sp. TUW77 TaxID=3152361 RepID=UPI003AB8EEC0
MLLMDAINEAEAQINCCESSLNRPVSWCYCSDLLSDVLANAKKDSIWITLQTHPNIVAVASLIGISAILISRGAEPDPETVAKAAQENIPVLTTKLPTFEAAGKLYNLLKK